MINIYRSIGLQRLNEDPKLFARLQRFMSDKFTGVAPGYLFDYYEYVFPKYVEFKVGKAAGQADCAVMHFSSNSFSVLVLDQIVEEVSGVLFCRAHAASGSPPFPIRLVRPDLLADPQPGDQIVCQMTAFSGDSLQIYDPGERPEPGLSFTPAGDLVISGEITEIVDRYFDFEDLHSDIQMLYVKTTLGKLPVVYVKGRFPAPKVGQMLTTDCLISADPLFKPPMVLWEGSRMTPEIPSYGANMPPYPVEMIGGFIPSPENAARVFMRCVREGSFDRLARCCMPELRFSFFGREGLCSREDLSALFASELGTDSLSVRDVHILSCRNPYYTGKEGFLLFFDEEEKAVVCLDTSSDHFLSRITLLDPAACELSRDPDMQALVTVCKCMQDPDAGFSGCRVSEECLYVSEPADYTAVGPARILRHFKNVAAAGKDSRFHYEIVKTADVLRDGTDCQPACKSSWCARLFMGDVVDSLLFVQLNSVGQISGIYLSSDGNHFADFPPKRDSSLGSKPDLREHVVQSYGADDPIKKLANDRHPSDPELAIWSVAARYTYFELNGLCWEITDARPAEDHIRFAGSENGADFALYLFACGEQDEELIGRDRFLSLSAVPENAGKRVFILYTRVIETTPAFTCMPEPEGDLGDRKCLRARSVDEPKLPPALWMIESVDGRSILAPFDEQNRSVLIDRLVAAFNSGDYDLACALLTRGCREKLPASTYIDARDAYEFFEILRKMNGRLKTAYLRFDKYVSRKAACWETGRFLFPLIDEGWIEYLHLGTLDEKYHELIISKESLETHPLNAYPRLHSFRCIPHSLNRFCLELTFENGEVKNYTLPTEGIGDEVALVEGYSFTDRIFFYGRLVDSSPDPDQRTYLDQRSRGQRIVYANGYSISTPELYFASPTELSDASIYIIE